MKKLMELALVAGSAAVACGVCAAEPSSAAPVAAEVEVAEKTDDSSFVSAEVGVDLKSKVLSYGLVDGKNPNLVPSGSVTFFDLLSLGMEWYVDTSHYSRKLGWGNRQWQYWEADFSASLDHTFKPDDFPFLPTAVELSGGYWYEYHPRRAKCKTEGVSWNPDTQFVWVQVDLPDVPLEPSLYCERDIDRDNGTYVQLVIGREFALVPGAGEDDDATLGLDVRLGQGFGNSQRVGGYLPRIVTDPVMGDMDLEPLHHSGLMDTSLVVTLNCRPTAWLTVGPYVGWYDFIFDSNIREGARLYEPVNTDGYKRDTSWHFVGGVAAKATF